LWDLFLLPGKIVEVPKENTLVKHKIARVRGVYNNNNNNNNNNNRKKKKKKKKNF